MLQMIEANWIVFALALLIGLLVAWWIFTRASSNGRERTHRPDVLDEGAAPAQRNQALIDAPPAATGTMAGVGEIVAAAAHDEVVQAAPAPQPMTPPTPAAGDDLSRIKGVGPKLVTLLHGLGVTSFAQIAAWDEAEIARIDAQLGAFAGRIERDNWIEQARLLTGGDVAAYEAKFGKL
jgi:predicted flap endonuclease-1-like 5' DNA nuclease